MNPDIKIEPEALRHNIMCFFGQQKSFDHFPMCSVELAFMFKAHDMHVMSFDTSVSLATNDVDNA